MKTNTSFLVILNLCLLGDGALAQQDIAYFSSLDGPPISDPATYSFGFEFEVDSPITVIGLSAYTGNPAVGFPKNTPVALWDQNQTEIASATVLAHATDPLTADGYFRYATLPSPLTLNPGDYYVAAEVDGTISGWDETFLSVGENDQTTIPGVTFISPQYAPGTLQFPYASSAGTAGFYGGNVVVSTVPEPGTFVLLLIGLAGALVFLTKPSKGSLIVGSRMSTSSK
jgi:hypothetical protein